MMERLRRARAVGEAHDASGSELPLVKMGGTMEGFFDKVRKETANGEALPNWYGRVVPRVPSRGEYELVEADCRPTHRKRRPNGVIAKARSSFARSSWSQPWRLCLAPTPIPNNRFSCAGRDLCRNHFHDTLPGSSIAMCVSDSDGKYVEIQATGNSLLDKALTSLAPGATKQGSGKSVFFNSLPNLPRREVVKTAMGFEVAESNIGEISGSFRSASSEVKGE